MVVRLADERQLPVAVARTPALLRAVGQGGAWPQWLTAGIAAADGDEEGASPRV
jgi:hypothetical protein